MAFASARPPCDTVRRLRSAAMVLAAATSIPALPACQATTATPSPTSITLLTSPDPRGPFHTIVSALVDVYARHLPGVAANAKLRPTETANVDALENGSAELVLATGGDTYVAYKAGTAAVAVPHTRLRAMASLFLTALKVVARRDSGVRTVAELRGKAVAVGPKGSPAERASALILDAYGLAPSDVRLVFEAPDDLPQQMRDGRLDAVVMFSPFRAAVLSEILNTVEAHLVPIEREKIALVQTRAPFWKSMVIPAGTYETQREDVTTVGVDVLLLCRDDLADELVYRLTATLFERASDLAAAHPAAAAIDADRAAEVPIPLHPGAARYYRERELVR